MPQARVMIVDDSTVVRRLLSAALAEDPAIEIAATAANGRIALAKLDDVNPDLIVLDLEMPEMDGLQTLAELRQIRPRLPTIVFSSLTQRGAAATLDALALGAADYVAKPSLAGSAAAAKEAIKNELIPKIKALCRLDGARPAAVPRLRPTAMPPAVHARTPEIIAIGVSTGGPNALADIFRQLPRDLPVPIVIVQHMPPQFTKYLAERLAQVSAIEIREAQSDELLTPGRAWLAPGDFHLSLAKTAAGVVTRLHQGPPENSCRPAVDVLFRSVAEAFGPAAFGVVLTGMGHDGLRGSEAIRAAGGRILAQDEASSVVWGMPGAVVQSGLAEQVLPLNRIAAAMSALTRPQRKPLALNPTA